jgi:hypothetical protein
MSAEDQALVLTKRLGKAQRADVLYLSERGPWQRVRTGYRLYELGICDRSSSSYRLTPLGREVARLLSEKSANPGSDDEWMAQYDAWEATRDRMRAEFIEQARARFTRDRIVSVESYGDEVRFTSSLTKATRPGVAYQVTDFEGDEPIGHREYQDLDEALVGLWDVSSPRTKGVPPVPNPSRQRNPLDYAVVVENGIRFETGVPVSFPFIRNTQSSPHFGSRFQQDIEPAGRYLLAREGTFDPPSGWEVDTIFFAKPLVIAFNANHGEPYYDEHSWKAQLHRAYGKKGKRLTEALLRDGYDGIVTVGYDQHGRPVDTKEIVDLRTMRSRNPSDRVRRAGSRIANL